jgi:hypothetical protein
MAIRPSTPLSTQIIIAISMRRDRIGAGHEARDGEVASVAKRTA